MKTIKITAVGLKTSPSDKNPSVNISSKDFQYSAIYDMYRSGDALCPGERLQIEEGVNSDAVKKMCRKISDAIKEYIEQQE